MKCEDLGFLTKNKKKFSKKTTQRNESKDFAKINKQKILREEEDDLIIDEYEDEEYGRFLK